MVKKTIIAIAAIVLLAAVFTQAANRWGYTRYGAVYYTDSPYYTYYPVYHNYPVESTSPPYGFDQNYRYLYDGWYPGNPAVSYPYNPSPGNYFTYTGAAYPVVTVPRSPENGLCGVLQGKQYGCTFGLVCDYTKTGQVGVGVCSKSTSTTTYPFQVGYKSTNYPYY